MDVEAGTHIAIDPSRPTMLPSSLLAEAGVEELDGFGPKLDALGSRVGPLEAKMDAGFHDTQAAFDEQRQFMQFLVERSENATMTALTRLETQMHRRFDQIEERRPVRGRRAKPR